MRTDLDLEALKHLLAEADESDPDVDPALYTAFRNALPDLIARVERAEKALKAATERVEEIIERANLMTESADLDTEERTYYEGRMEAAISLSNILTGDTPNV